MDDKQKRPLITSEFSLSLAMLAGAFAFVIGLLPAINPGLCNVSFVGGRSPLSYKLPYMVLALTGVAMITCAYLVQKRKPKDKE